MFWYLKIIIFVFHIQNIIIRLITKAAANNHSDCRIEDHTTINAQL